MKKIIYVILFLLLISSCEGFNHIEGVVMDSKTQLPISYALIIKNKNDSLYTDSLGKFIISHGMILTGPFGYPGMSVTFAKSGYKTIKKHYRGWKNSPVIIMMLPLNNNEQ
ncbi:hypothetical protein [Prevotella sp. Rep29]|uniref:hypothetical protein n=1 Tax=Prevotella sp. Rep29 TaxID=2691580 RepID=UPI001B6E0D58|nr:hypothetical protein [Prevotella sp. Rep29]MBP3834967.1 hypothetical protein [Prevotella sp.]QYR11419.1 hypothetical protein GRF55_10165 [Prevotella sp. Rep29]